MQLSILRKQKKIAGQIAFLFFTEWISSGLRQRYHSLSMQGAEKEGKKKNDDQFGASAKIPRLSQL